MSAGIKLIAFDLDGTVLNENWEMSARTGDALRKAHEHHVVTVVSTGRSIHTIPVSMRKLHWVDYIIASNGAVTINAVTGEVLRYCPMSVSVADEVISTAGAFSKSMDVMMSDCVLCGPIYKLCGDGSHKGLCGEINAGEPVLRPITIDKLPKRVLEKVVAVCGSREDRDRLLARFEKSKRITAVPASDTAVELTKYGVTKGAALDFLLRMLRVDRASAIAFGDSGNDLSMGRVAGCFIAMGNAPEEVRACADVVTLSVQLDGVAYFLEDQEWN